MTTSYVCPRCKIDLQGVAAVLGDLQSTLYMHRQAHAREDLASAIVLLSRARPSVGRELGLEIEAFMRELESPIY